MATLRGKPTTTKKNPTGGAAGRPAQKKKFAYEPATARQIQRAVGVTKEQLAIARALVAGVRGARTKTG